MAVMGLINIALMRNTASKLGITEITQRGDWLYFYIKSPTIEQITNLRQAYRQRVDFEDVKKPHIRVRLLQKPNKQKSSELMKEVLDIMSGNLNSDGIAQKTEALESKPNKYFKGKKEHKS